MSDGVRGGSNDGNLPLIATDRVGSRDFQRVKLDFGADGVSVPASPVSPFGELLVVERTPLIELKSVYGLSDIRDSTSAPSNGAITQTAGEYILAAGSDADGSASLSSVERGRYSPGLGAEVGIAVRRPSAPTGNQVARWGLFDTSNGIYFRESATGLAVATLRAGVETVVARADWNADKLDGTGGSGLTLDLTRGNIFQIRYSWYGYGTIEYRVILPDANNVQQSVVVHRFSPTAETSVADPNLPIAASAYNNGTAGPFTLYVAGRQYTVLGKYDPSDRIVSQRRLAQTGVSTTFLPAVSLRRKTGRENVSARLGGYSVIATADLVVQVRLNAALTGPSWATPTDGDATETAFEADISASEVSGGLVLYEDLVPGSSNQSRSPSRVDLPDIEIPGTQPVTLCVRTLSSTATAHSVLRLIEEW